MENSSPSKISPGSRIVFGPNAFGPGSTILAFVGMLAVIAIVAAIAFASYLYAHHGDIASLQRRIVSFSVLVQAVIDAAIIVYLAVVVPAIGKTTLRGLGFTTPTMTQIGIALLGALAMVVIVNGLGSIIDAALHTKHQQQAIQLFLSEKDPLVKLWFALLAVVIAPVAEELAFRVFIFNAVRSYSGFWLAAAVSGVFFGLAHTDPYAFVPLVFGGMILCGVYARSRNAWMSMLTHGLFNGVSVIALFVAPNLAK